MKIFTILCLFTFLFSFQANAQTGTVSGRVITTDNEPAIGISVVVVGTKIGAATDANGNFVIKQVPVGTQKISFSGIGYKKVQKQTDITADAAVTLNVTLESDAVRLSDVTVYGAARRQQKITEAPASVAVVTPAELERATSHGQIGKTLEHQAGIDVVQSGANDFNINTRGFNNSINRRVLVLIDGRDPSTPLLNLQEWNSLAATLADVQQIEVVRGPGSALFGTNAYNGVINITTFSPRQVLGTRMDFTAGDFQTMRADVRHAEAINDKWSYKFNVGFARERNQTLVSRQNQLEYAGVSKDQRPITEDEKQTYSNLLNARVDYEVTDVSKVTLEGGWSRSGNEMYVNTIGRILIPEADKPFTRLAFASPNWNSQITWNRRYTPVPQLVFNNATASSAELSDDVTGDVQYNKSLFNDKFRVVGGLSHQWQHINTTVAGAQPLLNPDNLYENFTGLYGQAEYQFLPQVQLVGAARFDRSTLIESKFSPKAAVVWTPLTNQTFRFTVNQSFLRPSYPDFYRNSLAGAPINLAGIAKKINDTLRAVSGNPALTDTLNLGTKTVTPLSLGNPTIKPEQSLSFEVGYKGILNKQLFVTADFYLNRRKNFISSPLGGLAPNVYPLLNTTLSNAQLSARANQMLADTLSKRGVNAAWLSVLNGSPALISSTANIGLIEEKGFELSANYYLTDALLLSANYAYINAKVLENAVTAQKIFPNTSPGRINIGAVYTTAKYEAAASFRYVEGFDWLAGIQQGYVPAYAVLNLSGGVWLTPQFKLSANVFNALDRQHYEIFGGTILRRYTTATATLNF